LPLENLFGGGSGFLGLTLDATHNARFETSVTGTTFVRSDDTVDQPDWVSRLTGRWGFGRWLLSYQMYYLSDVKSGPDATIENTPTPDIDSNMTHSLSLSWDVSDMFTVRAGVNNFTDEEPSYPTIAYGDILGRRWFVGATARF
jgi:outer membrane receptor protein involved in Fe transport